MTSTEFKIDSSSARALNAVLDPLLFTLEPARYDAFVSALDDPPAPGPKLTALLRRMPAWES